MDELTAKQRAFVEQLPLNQWNGTQAAIAAGYSEKSAGVMAHRLLKNTAIAKELDKRTAEIVEKTDVTVAEIIQELRKIAFAPPSQRVSNSDRLKALELLGKYLKMFTDKHVFGKDEPEKEQRQLSEEELAIYREAASKLNRLAATKGMPPFEVKGDTGKPEPEGCEIEDEND